MKRRFWALALGLVLAQAACTDMLTESPRAVLTVDGFYRTAEDARAAIVAAYQPWGSGDLFNTSLQWTLNASSDYARVGPEEENPNIVNLTRIGWNATNPYTTNAWNGFYTTITRANIVLERVTGTEMDETQRNYILGEARFLRALGYFYLARL
jgi:starch-binding outer membrane protein, SusD/RagB family